MEFSGHLGCLPGSSPVQVRCGLPQAEPRCRPIQSERFVFLSERSGCRSEQRIGNRGELCPGLSAVCEFFRICARHMEGFATFDPGLRIEMGSKPRTGSDPRVEPLYRPGGRPEHVDVGSTGYPALADHLV